MPRALAKSLDMENVSLNFVFLLQSENTTLLWKLINYTEDLNHSLNRLPVFGRVQQKNDNPNLTHRRVLINKC